MKPRTRRLVLSLAASPVLVVGFHAGSPLADVPDPTDYAPVAAVAVPDVATAQRTTTVLANAFVAAVASISDATPPGASPTDLAAGFAAVSALLPDCQSTYGLIDASGDPLNPDNLPEGKFEADGLIQLIGGAPVVQETVGGHLRTLVPLTNDMHPNCASCHTGYGAFAPGTVVGAAAFKVKL